VARKQHGLIVRGQLLRSGIDANAVKRLLRHGVLEEALPNVYRLPGAPRTWLQSLMAACLWAGDGAVASHRAAAALWGLDGFDEGPLEVTTTKKNQLSVRFRIHRGAVPPKLATTRRGVPVTNAARTLLDLCVCVRQERMSQVVDEALRKGLVSLDLLRRTVDSSPGCKGVRALRALVQQRDRGYQPSASQLQAVARRLLARAGWKFVEEFVVTDSEGNFVARVDFKLEGSPVVVEVDGRANHSSKLDWRQDLDRRNLVTAEGLAVVHATHEKLIHHPEDFLEEVARTEASYIRRRT
jgi:very-short-patch-repair endonuclease